MRRPRSTLLTVGNLLVGGSLLLALALSLPSPPARAEGVMPPPPGLSDQVEAPAISRRFVVQYNLLIYPAYLSWLMSANGQSDSIGAFAMFLETLPLTPYERACYMQCYMMYRR